MSVTLDILAGDAIAARLAHAPLDDDWSLAYTDAWTAGPQSFPFSPALPLQPPGTGYDRRSIKRFIENLLPEGHALDDAVAANGLAKGNVFGLIRALGGETAGVLRFRDPARNTDADPAHGQREITLAELDARIGDRAIPFTVWDGKIRMSIAGVQDKLLVYLDAPVSAGGRLFLVDGPRLASTHLLKPDLDLPHLPHLAVNEHFCMRLARRIGLPVADVELVRTPRPVLLVQRFDRAVSGQGDARRVVRRHMIDTCQACDLPVDFKYERYLGNNADVRHMREGVSFARLFALSDLAANKALAKRAMLQWALFQFLIGNSDAHGKNFSFFVQPGGYLEPTPWYDLVSMVQYDRFDTSLAMAFGDAFTLDEVTPFALTDFAARCGIDRGLMRREAQRLCARARKSAAEQAHASDYMDDERGFVVRLAAFVATQCDRLVRLTADAATVPSESL